MLLNCLFLLPHVNYALNYILVEVVDKSYFEMAPPKLYSTLAWAMLIDEKTISIRLDLFLKLTFFTSGLELGGLLGLIREHTDVGRYLLQVAISTPMTCARMKEMLVYDVAEKDQDGATTSNAFIEESSVIQGWKLFLKSLESKFHYYYCKIKLFK